MAIATENKLFYWRHTLNALLCVARSMTIVHIRFDLKIASTDSSATYSDRCKMYESVLTAISARNTTRSGVPDRSAC
jgi:hypothetical protein